MRCAERLGKGSFAILGRLTRVKILMGVKSRLDAAVAQATRSSNRGQKVRSSLKTYTVLQYDNLIILIIYNSNIRQYFTPHSTWETLFTSIHLADHFISPEAIRDPD